MNLDEIELRIEKSKKKNGELAETYLSLLNLERFTGEMKSRILSYVEANLAVSGSAWGESDLTTFGTTQPSPRSKVNEKAWQSAIESSSTLQKLHEEYRSARMAYYIDATQQPRTYIKRKKGTE